METQGFIFNKDKSDYGQNQSLFLGERAGLADTIHRQHDFIWTRIYKGLKSLDWDEQEFDFALCAPEFKTRPKRIVDIMRKTLLWQWEADSIASRTILPVMAPFISNFELQAAWTEVTRNECLTPDHEVLTPQGWRPIADIQVGDRVHQWVRGRGDESAVVTQVIQKHHEGVVVEIKSRERGDYDQVVTPNHRLPVFLKSKDTGKKELIYLFASQLIEERLLGNPHRYELALPHNSPIDNGIYLEDLDFTLREYVGTVYCLSVPSTAFMVRRNNVMGVTGNCVHALSYSEIVRTCFENPEEVLQEVIDDQEVDDRMSTVAQVMEECYIRSHQYAINQVPNDQETYNAAFLMTAALYVMERLQFMASFAVTFAIGEMGAFMAIAKCVQRICQDEFEIHAELDRYILEHEIKTERGKIALQQCWPKIKAMIDEVVEREITWNQKLLGDEPLPGLTAKGLSDWGRFCAASVYKTFGRKPDFEFPKENPLRYMEGWINLSKVQSAKKEQKDGQYKTNIVRKEDEKEVYEIDF